MGKEPRTLSFPWPLDRSESTKRERRWALVLRQAVDVSEPVENPFNIPATSEAIQVFHEVKTEMMLLFGIEEEEAVGRINRHWQGRQFLSEMELLVLCHDHHDEYWAKTIWYGPQSFWWVKDESTLSPLPWP